MAPRAPFLAARPLRAAFILTACIVAARAHAADSTMPPAALGAKPSAAAAASVVTKPLWIELTPAQQQALAPLASEWDKLEPARKKKWLAIGNKYASMNPDEQQRVQERMREWVKLTPDERRVARESYARTKRLDPEQKTEKWQQYQQLPEEQKKKLAADRAAKKPVATLPPASQGTIKTVPPIKPTLKPTPEQPAAPQGAVMPPVQPAQQPAPPEPK